MKALSVAERLYRASRPELLELAEQAAQLSDEHLRYLIIEKRRIDILAREVLGYTVAPKVHLQLAKHQFRHRESLSLIFRGAGKTTIGTIAKCIHTILLNPDVRILIASKTTENAEDMLKEIKNHFEKNEVLRRLFGDYVGSEDWSIGSITVKQRRSPWKEPTINTIGVLKAVASKHYDMIIADDLLDEENSRTKTRRDSIRTWYYKLLMPTLMPPHQDYPLRGQLHVIGTRYHFDDLYGHLQANEMKGATLIVRALDENNRSPWPEMFSAEHFLGLKEKMGSIIFNSQYQCDTELMKGEIFQSDDCKFYKPEELPDSVRVFMGVDLAIEEDDSADCFAIVVVAIEPKSGMVYVLDFYEGHLRFSKQTEKIIEMAAKWNPLRTAIEVNAYQKAQYQEVRAQRPQIALVPVHTAKDKVARAWQLAPRFEQGHVWFLKQHQHLIDHLVRFPGGEKRDLFDAFDLAMTASVRRAGRRDREPGLI